MRRAAAFLLAALALLAAACGSEDTKQEANALLREGFSTDVSSGVLKVDAVVDLEGVNGLDKPVRVKLEGPFDNYSRDAPPKLDWKFSFEAGPVGLSGRLIATGDNAYVEVGGTAYELGAETWRDFVEEAFSADQQRNFKLDGVDPIDWLEDAEVQGDEDIGGESTTKVSASVDLLAMLKGIFSAIPEADRAGIDDADLEKAARYVEDPELTAWIGEDGIWRRVETNVSFKVPKDERKAASGLAGGEVDLDIELREPNTEQQIEAPADARPLSELLGALGLESLLGPGFQVPAPG